MSMRNLDQLVRFPHVSFFLHPISYVSLFSVPLQPLAPPPLHRPTRKQYPQNPNLPHPLRRKMRNHKEISSHSSSDDLWRDVLQSMEIERQARQSRRSHLVTLFENWCKNDRVRSTFPMPPLLARVRLPFSDVIWTA